LDVYGTDSVARFGSNASNAIELRTDDSATGFWIRNDGSNTVISTKVGDLYFGYAGRSGLAQHFFAGTIPSEVLTLASNGNVGIGTTAPGYKLHVVGDVMIDNGVLRWQNANPQIVTTWDTMDIYLDTDNNVNADIFRIWHNGPPGSATNVFTINNAGNVGIGTTSPAYKLDVNGDIRTTGCLVYNGGTLGTCVSDRRSKENIQNLTFINPLEKVLNLQPKKFTFKNDSMEITGLIAQEVEQIAPELVTSDENGYKRIKYGYIQWLLLEAIKEQQKQIEQLQKENQELKSGLDNLESRIAMLEVRTK
jgi:hypothetical protein